MTIQENAEAYKGLNDPELFRQSFLRQIVVKICLFRMLFLLLLLLPLVLSKWSDLSNIAFFEYIKHPHFQIFLTVGLILTLFFLFSWNKFKNIILHFRLQLFADLGLLTYLILITGGTSSNFSFLYLGIVFIYGRILGMRTANYLAILVGLAFVLLSMWYYFFAAQTYYDFSLYSLIYFISLRLLALGLILTLLKMSSGSEHELLTQMARQQQEMRRSENLKYRVFDWMNSGLVVVDQEGRISLVNSKALDWANVSKPLQAIGRELSELYPGLYRAWSAWNKEESLRTELEQPVDGKIFGLTFTPTPEEKDSIILFRDITEIQAMENRIRQMEKLASIGELAAGLAHEIKNPLAGIKGCLQLLRNDNLDPDQQSRLQQVIHRNIQRLDHLLTDFLAFAKPSQADRKPVVLKEAVESCITNVNSHYLNVDFQIDASLDQNIWDLDPDQLEQILLNLLTNAAQAAQEHTEAPKIFVGIEQDLKGQYLYIADNGPGVDPDIINTVFDPFITTKKQGSGLGLSIAQRLADLNNTWIEMHNRGQNGLEVRIYRSNKYKQEELDSKAGHFGQNRQN